MQLILPHEMADFDALAAAVAAHKLHPEARIALGARIGREVRAFMALHKDRFPTIRAKDVDPAQVTRLIVVDFRRRSRLGAWQELLARIDRGEVEVVIYDHHPASEDDLVGQIELIEPVGSATTLLVERMRAQKLEVDAVEATLFSLGIHADTGSLTYGGTTGRDAVALGWLLDRGASPRLIARYLKPPFSAAQRRALHALLDAVQTERVSGLEVSFALARLPRAVDGLAEVATEALDLVGSAALFAVFDLRGRVQVVARSRTRLIDAAQVVSAVGGGGHAAAASATVKHPDASKVFASLWDALAAHPPRPARVGDLMSSPVRTVAHDTPLSALSDSGAPVLRDGKLVGIVTRRDVERARAEGRLGLPVSSCMTQRVWTTTPEASLEEAVALMEEHDVGRLPVLRDGRLIGIVTRSDLLRVLYASRSGIVGS